MSCPVPDRVKAEGFGSIIAKIGYFSAPLGTPGSAGPAYQPGFKQVNREGSKFESTTSMSFM